jgi:hypothetical protein
MRSALVGTASNVVALKTTAAVPMSVIERMFHLLCGVPQQRCAITCVPRKVLVYFLKWRTFLSSVRNIFPCNFSGSAQN